MKISFFTGKKNLCILHGQVFIMLYSNSPGTYNNQYMVLDLKQIELNKEIRDNALWVVEQIPGYVGMADVTDILREGILQVGWSIGV